MAASATGPVERLIAMSDQPSRPESKTDKRKQSLYFPETMLSEMKEEAQRLNRSLSWVVQRAWKVARRDVKKMPGTNDVRE